MRIGLQYPAATVGGDPVAMREFAQAAEELGYAHLTINDTHAGLAHFQQPDWWHRRVERNQPLR